MSDQNVTVKVGAEALGDVKKPFADLKAGADMADDALLRPRNRLKEIGGELRATEKGLKSFQSGLLGLTASAGLVDDRFARLTVGLHGLHSATQLFRGAGGLAGLTAGALLPVGLAIAGIGAAAIAASPALQDKLGSALGITAEAARRTEERLRSLRNAQEDLAVATQYGIGTKAGEDKASERLRATSPFETRISGLSGQQREMEARVLGFSRHPDQAFDPTREALDKINQTPIDTPGAGGRGLGLGQREAALRGLMEKRFETPAHLQRDLLTSQAGQNFAIEQDVEARRRRKDFDERAAIGKRLSEIEIGPQAYLMGARGLAKEAGEADRGAGALGRTAIDKLFGQDHVSSESRLRNQMADVEARVRANAPEAARLRAQLGNRKLETTTAENDAINGRQQEAADQLRGSSEKLLEVKHRIRQAEIENLRAIQGTVAEQAKLAGQVAREEEARLRGSKVSLGLMSPQDLHHAQAIAGKIAGGKDLNQHELQFARGLDIFQPGVEAQGLRRSAQNPVIQGILQKLGAEQRVAQAKDREQSLLKLDAQVKTEINLKVAADQAQMAKQIGDLMPELNKSIQQATAGLAKALEALVGQHVQAALQKLRDAAQPGAK